PRRRDVVLLIDERLVLKRGGEQFLLPPVRVEAGVRERDVLAGERDPQTVQQRIPEHGLQAPDGGLIHVVFVTGRVQRDLASARRNQHVLLGGGLAQPAETPGVRRRGLMI